MALNFGLANVRLTVVYSTLPILRGFIYLLSKLLANIHFHQAFSVYGNPSDAITYHYCRR